MSATTTRAGVVYLLECSGYHKIGLSRNLEKRCAQLSIALPFDLQVVHTIRANDVRALEIYWHGRFATRRVRGEWFKLSSEDVAEFCAQTAMDVPRAVSSMNRPRAISTSRIYVSAEMHDLAKRVGNRWGISPKEVAELAIRERAEREGVQ